MCTVMNRSWHKLNKGKPNNRQTDQCFINLFCELHLLERIKNGSSGAPLWTYYIEIWILTIPKGILMHPSVLKPLH